MAGFPTGNEPLLPADERDNLQRFLKESRGGKSWVLITSRREERWLDCGYTLLNLKVLDENDAEEFAAKVLRTAEVDRAKLPPEYLELLKLLGGHPLSLRVVLPHLKTQSPVQLIEDLRRGGDRFSGVEEEGRDKSLIVSLDYSFARLSERCRRHLPFLAFFSERVYAEILYISVSSNSDGEQPYRAVFGENLQKLDWLQILNEASTAGILEFLGGESYKIHPALPWYLRQQLSERQKAKEVSELEKKLLHFYAWLAQHYRKKLVSNAQEANIILQFEESNLLQNLRLAENEEEWWYAQLILEALGDIYKRIGRKPESRLLRRRALDKLGIHLAQAKAKGQKALDFWMYLRVEVANEALESADLKTAWEIYQENLDELNALNDPYANRQIAVLYHQLGIVAEDQQNYEEAFVLFQKALQICKDIGDWYEAAREYHQLGNVTFHQRNYQDALAYYKEAQTIWENAGDLYLAAHSYHQIGLIAEEKRDYGVAIIYYGKALNIFDNAKDFHSAAGVYHQLGNVALRQKDPQKAIIYYQKALKIYEDAEDYYSATREYYQLGIIAQEAQQDYEVANAYYRKALEIYMDKKDFDSITKVYNQLGKIAAAQGDFDKAIEYFQANFVFRCGINDWYTASINLFFMGQCNEAIANWHEAIKNYISILKIGAIHDQESVVSVINNLAEILKMLGETHFESIWREVTGEECAGMLRAAIWAAWDNLETE